MYELQKSGANRYVNLVKYNIWLYCLPNQCGSQLEICICNLHGLPYNINIYESSLGKDIYQSVGEFYNGSEARVPVFS